MKKISKRIILILFLILLLIIGIIYFYNYKVVEKYKNQKYKICVLMWYNDKIKDYADKCYEINKKYCKKYGFDIIKSHKRFYKDRSPHYERLPLILNNLEKYDYIIWIDADAHFDLNSNDISVLIDKYSNYNFILSGDIDDNNKENKSINRQKSSIINSGVMIVKNSKYSKKVIKHWVNSDELLKKKHKFHDQGIIRLYMAENINNFNKETIVLQYGVIQRFFGKKYSNYISKFPYLSSYKPYIMHYGEYNNERLKHITKYYNNHLL